MKNQIKNNIVLSLARVLQEKDVDNSVICKALELICADFDFDCGALYETDYATSFKLKESFGDAPCKNFDIGKINSNYRAFLSNQPIVYIEKTEINIDDEKNILELFKANSLFAIAVTDDKLRICQLIVFTNKESEKSFCDDEKSLLFTLLSMLNKYAQVGVYYKKIILTKASLEDILDNTGIDIYVNDFNNHDILYVNKSMAEPYGGQEQFIGHKCWQVLFPGQSGPCHFCPKDKLIDENGKPTLVYSWNYQRPFDGKWFRVFSAAFYWMDGRLAHVISSADITENKRNQELVEYMANYDTLTNLPNRRKLINDCKERIDKAQKGDSGFVLFFDIDGFKAINDNYGHDEGDEFLIQLGKFFSDIPLLKDNIYRNGGDEFVALMDGNNISESSIRNLYFFINHRFKRPWKLKKASVYCGISVGVACYPEDGQTAEKLLQNADKAMYHIKKKGGRGIAFSREVN